MPRAYVLINVEPGAEDKVKIQLRSVGSVKESFVSYGVYDLIAVVEAETMDELKEAVTYKIRTVSQVVSTLTLMVTEEKAIPK